MTDYNIIRPGENELYFRATESWKISLVRLCGRGWQKYSSANHGINSMEDDLGVKGKPT